MNNKEKILWITRTAIFMALLIVLQATTASWGNLVAGPIVNFMLIITVMTCGLASGLYVSAFSPIIAKFLGIGPLWSLIPFIAAGNISLAFLWHFIGNRNTERKYLAYAAALACASVTKFLVLYVGIVRIAVPMILGLPEQQAAVISIMFSIPQLINAIVGGVFAIVLLPALKKAIGERQE